MKRAIKRLFTHPCGDCHIEGCDQPRERFADFCNDHIVERMIEAQRRHDEREFNRQADIVAEGIRRARENFPRNTGLIR
jgi:hypothetical protein